MKRHSSLFREEITPPLRYSPKRLGQRAEAMAATALPRLPASRGDRARSQRARSPSLSQPPPAKMRRGRHARRSRSRACSPCRAGCEESIRGAANRSIASAVTRSRPRRRRGGRLLMRTARGPSWRSAFPWRIISASSRAGGSPSNAAASARFGVRQSTMGRRWTRIASTKPPPESVSPEEANMTGSKTMNRFGEPRGSVTTRATASTIPVLPASRS